MMRTHLLCLVLVLSVVAVFSAPARSALDTGVNDNETPYVEEVMVEAVLNVRSPSSRQARTQSRTNLQDGARVAEATNTS